MPAHLKYRTFIRALGIPDGAAAHQLYEAAVREGITSVSEAKRIFIGTLAARDLARWRALYNRTLPGAARLPLAADGDKTAEN